MTKHQPEFDVERVRELIAEYRDVDNISEEKRIEREVLQETVEQHFRTTDDWTPIEELGDEELFWEYMDCEAGYRRENMISELYDRGIEVLWTLRDKEHARKLVEEKGLDLCRTN